MTIERGLCVIAGIVVLASLLLARFHSPYWLALTVLAGLNLFQSGFTNWCPMVCVLKRAGMKPCCARRKRRPTLSCWTG